MAMGMDMLIKTLLPGFEPTELAKTIQATIAQVKALSERMERIERKLDHFIKLLETETNDGENPAADPESGQRQLTDGRGERAA